MTGSKITGNASMSDESLHQLRRSVLASLATLETQEHQLSGVLTQDCAEEMLAYITLVRDTREQLELLEQELLRKLLNPRTD